MLDALWASVIATIVLIVINFFYLTEMQKARKAEFIPNLKARLSWLGPTFLILQITNFGRGPAMNVKAKIVFRPSEEERLWETSIFSPGESIRIFLPEGNVEKVLEKSSKITIEGEYRDIFNQTFSLSETIDVQVFVEQTKQLRQMWEKDIVYEIESVKNELEHIRTELKRLYR